MIFMKKIFIFTFAISIAVLLSVSAFSEPVNSQSDFAIEAESTESDTVNENDEKTISTQEEVLTDTDNENVDSDDSQSADGTVANILSANKASAVETATWVEIKSKFKDF